MEKICAKCGHVNLIEKDNKYTDIVKSIREGAKEYMCLWHFPIEMCEHCNYASRDISRYTNVNIPQSEIDSIINNPTLIAFNEMRDNKIIDYLLASLYYKYSGDKLNSALCMLQAGDDFYGEFTSYIDYNLESDDHEIENIEKVGINFYDQAIEMLKEYCDENSQDYKYKLLLIGVLMDNGASGQIEGNFMLKNIDTKNLNAEEKKIYNFLCFAYWKWMTKYAIIKKNNGEKYGSNKFKEVWFSRSFARF